MNVRNEKQIIISLLIKTFRVTFKYNRPASRVNITVGAKAYSKKIFSQILNEPLVCFDVYGKNKHLLTS